MNRKRVILGALLGVLAICLVYAYLATPRLEKAPPRVAGQRTQPVDPKAVVDDENKPRERIDFAYQAAEPQEYSGAQRDIFQFGRRRPVKTTTTAPIIKTAPEPVVMPEVVPIEVVQQSLGQFTFLGFLEKGGEKTVFLSSGGNLFLVKQGERFGADKEFLVEQIDDKLLKVSHAGREGLIEIELIEQQKLNAAVSAPARISRDAGPSGQAVNPRIFRPQGKSTRPSSRQESQDVQEGGQELQELMDEYNQDQVQEPENPVEENATEGEVNGKNQ